MDTPLTLTPKNPCPILIIDGPRAAGKSTMADRIVKEVNDSTSRKAMHYFYKGAPHPIDELSNMTNLISEAVQRFNETGTTTVFDRFHVSELVMSVGLNRRPAWDVLFDCQYIDGLLAQHNAMCFVLLPDVFTLDNRLNQRNAILIKQGKKTKAHDMNLALVPPLWRMASAALTLPQLIESKTDYDQVNLTMAIANVFARHHTNLNKEKSGA